MIKIPHPHLKWMLPRGVYLVEFLGLQTLDPKTVDPGWDACPFFLSFLYTPVVIERKKGHPFIIRDVLYGNDEPIVKQRIEILAGHPFTYDTFAQCLNGTLYGKQCWAEVNPLPEESPIDYDVMRIWRPNE